MKRKQELTCIGCPMGCLMEVVVEDGVVRSITGNACRKGELYAAREVVDPRRMLTSIVPVAGGTVAMVPVKTAAEVPKASIRACMEAIRNLRLEAPVALGQVVVANLADTGIALVATRAIGRK